jgi:hypothetical protein
VLFPKQAMAHMDDMNPDTQDTCERGGNIIDIEVGGLDIRDGELLISLLLLNLYGTIQFLQIHKNYSILI